MDVYAFIIRLTRSVFVIQFKVKISIWGDSLISEEDGDIFSIVDFNSPFF